MSTIQKGLSGRISKKSYRPKTIKTIRTIKYPYNFYLTSYSYFETNQDIINFINKICDWGNDDDASDFFDMYIGELEKTDFYLINYRIANLFFRLFIDKSKNFDNIEKPLFLEELIECIKTNYDEAERLIILKKFLKIIKNSLILLINYYNIYFISLNEFFNKTNRLNTLENIPKEIFLYRGFNIKFNNEIIDYVNSQIESKNKDNIIINSVISTSISEEVAYRFLGKGSNGIVWKIRVPIDNYDVFKYSFLKKILPDTPPSFLKINNYNLLYDNNSEYEFLLNYGAKLRYNSIDKKTVKINRFDEDENVEIITYNFDFLNYDLSSIDNFDEYIENIIDGITDLSIKN